MRICSKPRNRRVLTIGVLLAALLWRALIPSGFMPAVDGTLALAICPEDMPGMTVGQDADHLHGNSHTEHCPFGAAPFAAPLPSVVVTTIPSELASTSAQQYHSLRLAVRNARAHQPRGPPA